MSFYYQNIFTQPGLGMAKMISPVKKQEYLPFIKSNFGKISQREIARGKMLANHIYKNSTLFLERKYLSYKKNVLEVENGK